MVSRLWTRERGERGEIGEEATSITTCLLWKSTEDVSQLSKLSCTLLAYVYESKDSGRRASFVGSSLVRDDVDRMTCGIETLSAPGTLNLDRIDCGESWSLIEDLSSDSLVRGMVELYRIDLT